MKAAYRYCHLQMCVPVYVYADNDQQVQNQALGTTSPAGVSIGVSNGPEAGRADGL
jgi:hypothetical protein